MLEPEWTEAIGTELRWLADLLGAVRDLDVLEARLREAIEPDARGELDPLFVALEARRKEARDRLRDGLSSTRYQALLCRLEEAVVHPPTNPRGLEPCRTALPRRLASMWKRARREGRRLDQDASDKEFHRVRILTKRARFATEAIAPALEGSARQAADRFARQAVRLQDTLGALQDTVIAIQFVDQFTTAQPDRRPLHRAARRLVRELKRDRAKARSRFPRAWSKLDRKRNLGWAWIG
jgi:CHAD domain-containing protein